MAVIMNISSIISPLRNVYCSYCPYVCLMNSFTEQWTPMMIHLNVIVSVVRSIDLTLSTSIWNANFQMWTARRKFYNHNCWESWNHCVNTFRLEFSSLGENSVLSFFVQKLIIVYQCETNVSHTQSVEQFGFCCFNFHAPQIFRS